MTVVIVGFGNIGSALLALLVRALEIGRFVLVDPDRYEAHNLIGQNVRARDVGLYKVEAMERLVAEVRGEVEVVTHAKAVEDVPLGYLRGDVIVSCVDSRSARQAINAIAWRLDMPLVDAAVQAEGMLARVTVYRPGPGQPCLECLWDVDDYRLLEPVYACVGGARSNPAATSPAPTNAPVELGGFAAACQAMEVRRVLAGDFDFAGHQLFVNARDHMLSTARFSHNPACRFDHRTFRTTSEIGAAVSEQTTIGALLDVHRSDRMSVTGHDFVFEAVCSACAELQPIGPLLSRDIVVPACARCGGERTSAGQSMRDWLPLPEQPTGQTLAGLGLRDGDVLSLQRPAQSQSTETIHLQLGRAT